MERLGDAEPSMDSSDASMSWGALRASWLQVSGVPLGVCPLQLQFKTFWKAAGSFV